MTTYCLAQVKVEKAEVDTTNCNLTVDSNLKVYHP